MYDDLQAHLRDNLRNLSGEWVKRKDNYENDICSLLNMRAESGRYWDAVWNQYHLEFKKGRSVWLDLVRYSEILLRQNDNARRIVLNLFFIPNRHRTAIDEIICVETIAIIRYLNLSNTAATELLELSDSVPRSLNAQASLTIRDLRNLATFRIC